MIICSALYYFGSLDHPESLVRDNRYYPGKAVQAFPVWWAYLRKHYPTTQVCLFADTASPIPIEPLLTALPEPWYEMCDVLPSLASRAYPLVWVKWLSSHSRKYFRSMQRNLVEAICLAYRLNEDLLFIDNDCFCNTNVLPLLAGMDMASSDIEAHQMTMGSVFFYISKQRLHALDGIGIDLPNFLMTMLNDGPLETRMHTLQEGGLYKLFCYGKARVLGPHIQLSHLSCYEHFVTFLRRNPVDTPQYRDLLAQLASFDMDTLHGVEMTFLDMMYPENATLKEAQ